MEGGKKVSLHRFVADQQQVIAYQIQYDCGPPKMPLKLAV